MRPLIPRSPLVVNAGSDPFDVYVGRGSPWGNQFRIGGFTSRAQAIEKFARWVRTQPELLGRIRTELRSKVLG